MFHRVVVASLLLPSLAHATPTTMAQQGRLLDTLGNPIQGSHSLTLRLHTAQTEGMVVWNETVPAELTDGYFAVEIGHTVDLDDTIFTGADRWLSVAVDGAAPLDARKRIAAIPYATMRPVHSGSGTNNTECYSAHRADNVLAVMELSP